ncbi:DUF3108 domain-containing protein [Derxia gummosa]|uniref:DUF3108 domain-containing protein n=1 Tax=Derxia gummosa DSM 723 TaxID=1121388 RepID=A0A8B6X0R4_9BURK|nr:DUF3108 domain-containing protein [Derxia gummosa]
MRPALRPITEPSAAQRPARRARAGRWSWIALSALLHLVLLWHGWQTTRELGADGKWRDPGVQVELADPEPAAPRPPLAGTDADPAPRAANAAPGTDTDTAPATDTATPPQAAPAPANANADTPAPAATAPDLPDNLAGELAPDAAAPAPLVRDGSTAPDASAGPATPVTGVPTARADASATPPANAPDADARAAQRADVAAADDAPAPWPGDWPSPVPGQRREMRVVPPSRQLDFNARAVVNGNEYFGKGVLRWRIGHERYSLEQEASLDLLVTSVRLQNSTSTGRLGETGLEPLRYTEKTRTRAQVATNFNRDPAHNSISFSASTAVLPLEPGVQDRASVTMQLAILFASRADEITDGTIYHLLLAGVRGAEPWVLRAGGPESIDTPFGPLRVRRIERLPRPGSRDNRVEVWFAMDYGWLPVRIRHIEANGNLTELTVASITALPDLPP